jgi:hypothetical protein
MSKKIESETPVAAATTCSALDAALTLVDFGPCRGSERPQDWINVAGPMCAHCRVAEDVNLAAARIIAAEYRKALAVIESIEERYIDGSETYEDWKFMGQAARDYLLPPNETNPATGSK